MREILFRGKRVDNGEWVSGRSLLTVLQDNNYLYYIPQQGEDFKANPSIDNDRILSELFGNFYQVDPKTVGQYTGLTDKNGNKIFEGDILKVNGLYPNRQNDKIVWEKERIGEVYYYNGAFFFGEWNICSTSEKAIEIIGNVFDNPELLEVE